MELSSAKDLDKNSVIEYRSLKFKVTGEHREWERSGNVGQQTVWRKTSNVQ